jgi:hypothetical protein
MKRTTQATLTLLFAATVALSTATARAEDKKNWTPPAYEIYAQTLADKTMAEHPELLSVTFHGVPPGMKDAYTMFAGSYKDRIGNADDPDDIDVQTKGITIVDPRWHRYKDPAKKFVVQLPMRDAAGENIGLVVYAFKDDHPVRGDERKFYTAALDLRDALEAKVPSYGALFQKVQ